MPFGMRALVVPALVLTLLSAVRAGSDSSPVVWSVKMGGTADSIIITVLPSVRIKDVRCEMKLLGASGEKVGSFTARIAHQDDASLPPGAEYSETFTLTQPGVKSVEGLLLFARPALSSPKAAAGSSSEILGRGIPPLSSSR